MVDVETEQEVIGEKISNLKFRLRLSLYHQSREEYEVRPNAKVTTRLYHYGERIRFAAKLRPPSTPGFADNQLEAWRQNIHNSIVQKIHALWSPRDAALLDAMVIGDDAFLNYDTRVDFQRSGTYHIPVVSGLNLIILAFVDSGPFDDCGRMKSSPAPSPFSCRGSTLFLRILGHRSGEPS